MIQSFSFHALPVTSPGGEAPDDNETRFRREVERAFRFGDTALQALSNRVAALEARIAELEAGAGSP